MEDKRNYGIDLLKITSMLMVVAIHVNMQGGILPNTEYGSLNYFAAYLIETLCYCAVNCFAIITGYLMVDRKIKYRKIFSLWFTVFFYYIVTCIVASFFIPNSLSLSLLANALVVTQNTHWYFTSYFCVFMLIPFLNIFISHIQKRDYIVFLIIGFILFSAVETFSLDFVDPFQLQSGYSP